MGITKHQDDINQTDIYRKVHGVFKVLKLQKSRGDQVPQVTIWRNVFVKILQSIFFAVTFKIFNFAIKLIKYKKQGQNLPRNIEKPINMKK